MSRLRQQRRGKGGSNYRSPRRGVVELNYGKNVVNYRIQDIIRDPARNCPLVICKNLDTMETFYNIATVGNYNGQIFNTAVFVNTPGLICTLEQIELGTKICNIQLKIGQSSTMSRAAGCYAQLLKKEGDEAIIKRGKRFIKLPIKCLATVGIPAGGGHTIKPKIKAGTNIKSLRSKAKKAYTVSAKNKNHHEHPFGASKSKSPGRPKTSARNSPPGAKVGSIAARRTGRKKRK
jgi:large subunit ribosomal protein L2